MKRREKRSEWGEVEEVGRGWKERYIGDGRSLTHSGDRRRGRVKGVERKG